MSADVDVAAEHGGLGGRAMTLRQLHYFVRVARVGSINRAAGDLRVAQSAVTRQIQALEGCLGVRLLEHSARGVRLTGDGQRVLELGQAIVDLALQARQSTAAESLHLGESAGHSP